jgi:septal ring factor EnvC (AmiA/AmiB activator)
VISDLEAIKAIDRLCRAAPRNLDLDALRVWIAAHCGLNPHAAKPLDPDAPLLAARDKLAATLAAMRDKADRLAALLAASETRGGELAAELAAVKKSGKRPPDVLLSPSNADKTPKTSRATKTKPERKAYMRELMRKKRAGKRQQAAPADTADKAATPAADGTAAG